MAENDDGLDKERRKRLEKLGDNWHESVSAFNLKQLTAADLRLLFEHFEPLQELIRTLVAAPAGGVRAVMAQQTSVMSEALVEDEDKLRIASVDLSLVQSELREAQSRCLALQRDLAECNAAAHKLLQAKDQLEKQLQQSQNELSACRVEMERLSKPPVALTVLRGDAVLAQRLELSSLPNDDTTALIKVVAVLAQRDNLERLWHALKDRCEARNRPASEAEVGLLSAALDWYNHNWRTRPYRLIEAAQHAPYDFERHLRCRLTSSGEMVSQQHLPGIADGGGKLLCKVLVSTE